MYRNFKLQSFIGQLEVLIHVFAIFLYATNDNKFLEIFNFTVAKFMIIRNNIALIHGLQNKDLCYIYSSFLIVNETLIQKLCTPIQNVLYKVCQN
jgi:hypothetical protein